MTCEKIPVVQIETPLKRFFRSNRWLLARRSCQLLVLGLFLAGPLFGWWVVKGNLASSELFGVVSLTDPLIMLQSLAAGHYVYVTAVIGAVTVTVFYLIMGGRLYCSWVCPINPVTDLAHWLRLKSGLGREWKIPRWLRYALLGVIIVLSGLTGTIIWEFVNPITLLHRSLVFGLGLGWTVVLLVLLFDLFVSPRGWCGSICPVGACYGLLGSKSLIKVNAEGRDRCTDCGDCYRVCPEPHVIVPALTGKGKGGSPVILSGECTSCGRCIDVCDEQVFGFGHRYSNSSRNQQKPDAIKDAGP